MNAALHLCLILSLLVAFVQAPFLHVHPGDPSHEHAHGWAHAHWTLEPPPVSADPSVRAAGHDGDAQFLDWVAGDGTSVVKFTAALPDALTLPVPSTLRNQAAVAYLPSHDPPWRFPSPSRAPPA